MKEKLLHTMIARADAVSADLWETLAAAQKPIVLYGMGNGADKILAVFEQYGIPCADVFASDDFVRGQSFHGKVVGTYTQMKERYQDFIVVVAFATARPEVLERIFAIAAEQETYIPDVPVFGDTLFTRAFYAAHRKEIVAAGELLADAHAVSVFGNVLRYKLTGKPEPLCLSASFADEEDSILRYDRYTSYADLGAYNGDTIRKYLARCPNLQKIFAFEPDPRNFRKLSAYAQEETRAEIHPVQAAAYDHAGIRSFATGGNRNSSIDSSISTVISPAHRPKEAEIRTVALDDLLGGDDVDFIKYDVEGAEEAALRGCRKIIARCSPDILLSIYHRSEDLFTLIHQLHALCPDHQLYLRRQAGIPAWDLNLYAIAP